MNSKEIELFAHFDDGDPAGILYFANYLRFTQRAFELSLAKESLSWKDWFDHPEWGIPLRHAESEYHRPLRPGQKCFVRQGVTRLGETSLTIKSEILDE